MKMLAPQMPPPPLYVKKICPIQSGNVDNLTWENDLSINFVSMCETKQLFKGYQTKIEETPSAVQKNSINFDLDGYTTYVDVGKSIVPTCTFRGNMQVRYPFLMNVVVNRTFYRQLLWD